MSTIHSYETSHIRISEHRQRRHFDGAAIIELANSIQTLGLLQPITVAAGGELVAGERRLRACKHLAVLGIPVRCGNETYPLNQVPVIFFDFDDETRLWEAQLHENIRRENLTWPERAAAEAFLHELRCRQNPKQTFAQTAAETPNTNGTALRDAVIVAAHLEDKEVSSAPTLKDAMKVLRKRDEKARLSRLSASVNVAALSSLHSLQHCDFRAATVEDGSIDTILTDPPYGMGAQAFKDGGDPSTVLHDYDDMDGEEWQTMIQEFAAWSWAKTKPKAHIYVFCDIDKFPLLRSLFSNTGYLVHRTPLVYAKSHASSRRVPWPTMGPRRGYELVLYAVKGDRNVNVVVSDVFSAGENDENLGHAAQKPVGAYVDLLRRSVAAGDCVCDPFAGTGTILPAAHLLKCRAIAIERDASFHGIALERLAKLKE